MYVVLTMGLGHAQDGTKDGIKTIYIEFRESATGYIKKETAQVFLDTQVPILELSGLLKQGTQGSIYKLNQRVPISWLAEDRSVAGRPASGFHPKEGFQYGVSHNGDCSKNSLQSISDWKAPRYSEIISWPEGDPLKAFYFCIYMKDRAGNVAVLLSQPMTSIWNVIAGDNSLGNGSSVNANTVRFKEPVSLYKDPDNNLYFYEAKFGVSRVIKNYEVDPARTIESSAVITKEAAVYDSNRNLYYVYSDKVVRRSPSGEEKNITVQISKTIKIGMRTYDNKERLLIGVSDQAAPGSSVLSYIAEIKTEDIDSLTSPISQAKLFSINTSGYRILGNGYSEATSDVLFNANKEGADLGANDPFDAAHTLGFIKSIVGTVDGHIFVATTTDGQSLGWGHSTIRRLTPKANGKFQQFLVDTTPWMTQLAYHQYKSNGQKKEILAFGQSGRSFILYDLTENKIQKNIGSETVNVARGITIIPTGESTYDIYVGSSGSSYIHRFNQNLELVEELGRKNYENSETEALSKAIGTPDGLFVDKTNTSGNGEIYISDGQFQLIYKLGLDGKINCIVDGKGFSDLNRECVADLSGKTVNNYVFRLNGDFTEHQKVLYQVKTTASPRRIDLSNFTVSDLYPMNTGSGELRKYNWSQNSLAILKESNSRSTMYISHYDDKASVGSDTTWTSGFTGFVQKISLDNTQFVAGTQETFLGDVRKNKYSDNEKNKVLENSSVALDGARAGHLVADLAGYIYSSGKSFIVSHAETKESRYVDKVDIQKAFVVIADPSDVNKRYIIYNLGSTLARVSIDLKKIFTTANPVISGPIKMCMPGTQLRNITEIVTDHSGNLILADANNARVLKYRIVKNDGSLQFYDCP